MRGVWVGSGIEEKFQKKFFLQQYCTSTLYYKIEWRVSQYLVFLNMTRGPWDIKSVGIVKKMVGQI